MADLIRRFLAHTFTPKATRFEMRCAPEERAAYDAAARLSDHRDTSAWARRVLTLEARKVLAVAK